MNVYMKEPQKKAQACVIWMHGLGADAQDMRGLADQLMLTVDIRHVFIDAPVRPVTLNSGMLMRAWYDIVGMKLTDREDRDGIVQSEAMILDVINRQIADGFSSDQIFLAGFSQGGAMALFTGLRSTTPLAGLVVLSAYLPLATDCKATLAPSTPVFIAGGTFDPLVLPNWTKQSFDWLQAHDFDKVSWHEYPMEHSICMDEIRDLASWFNRQVPLITSHAGEM